MRRELPDQKRLVLLGKLAYGEVLDVGCQDLQNPYLKNVVGFDLQKPEKGLPNYIEFIQGDCEVIDTFFPESSFDTIVAGELIEHLENPTSFLKGCHKILKDNGQLLLTTPNPYELFVMIGSLLFIKSGIHSGHINLFPFQAMIALLDRTGWKCVDVKNASGGMRLRRFYRKYYFPCPKSLAWQHLYICKKKEKLGP